MEDHDDLLMNYKKVKKSTHAPAVSHLVPQLAQAIRQLEAAAVAGRVPAEEQVRLAGIISMASK